MKMSEWISVNDRLPEVEDIVLVLVNGEVYIGGLFVEHPSFEDTFIAYKYWDDPTSEGRCWEWPEVTHWMTLPEPPKDC